MASTSPSDFCWVLRNSTEQQWIAPVVHAAIEMKWQQAKRIAAGYLGDEALAVEMMERAVERTVRHLSARPPVTVEEASRTLASHYRLEVRRVRTSHRKLGFQGSSLDLEQYAARDAIGPVESSLDLETILRETSPPLRAALMMRYGGYEKWSDVAESMGTTAEAIRKACAREIRRIRLRLGMIDPRK